MKVMKQRNKIKFVLYLLVVVALGLTFYIISDTYALFEREASGSANFDIAQWVIKLNNIDISSGETISFSLSNFVYATNSHVANGYIAPGRNGYFDIVLDPAGTEVAVRYDITLDLEGDYSDNLTYSVTTADGMTIRTGENTYSGVIDMSSIENDEVATLRINLEWEDIASYNASDTALGLIRNNDIEIPASITVVQYLGETLTEYTEE